MKLIIKIIGRGQRSILTYMTIPLELIIFTFITYIYLHIFFFIFRV